MTLDTSSHATFADVKLGGVAAVRMMVGLFCGTTGGRFCPLHRGRSLGSLAARYVGNSSSACKSLENGGDQTNVVIVTPKDLSVICVRLTTRVLQNIV